MEHIPQIRYIIQELNNDSTFDEIFDKLDPIEDIADLIEQAIEDEPPISVTDGNLIKPGYSQELDEYVDAMKNGKAWLAELEITSSNWNK